MKAIVKNDEWSGPDQRKALRDLERTLLTFNRVIYRYGFLGINIDILLVNAEGLLGSVTSLKLIIILKINTKTKKSIGVTN